VEGTSGSAQWQRVVFDFDGTLAHRSGMWSGTLLDVLDANAPGHTATLDGLRASLRDGFPWHTPDEPHLHLNDPEAWWQHMSRLFSSVFATAGVDHQQLPMLVARTREQYCDPAQFALYDDTADALHRLVDARVEVVILSNHVPELPRIVAGLGIADLIDKTITSAAIGYEKPHPEAFAHALVDVDPTRCCMIGDNPAADIDGAAAAGMHAILVRHPDARVQTVAEAVELILKER